MQIEYLRKQIAILVERSYDEDALLAAFNALSSSDTGEARKNKLVSFDADGTGYTAEELGDMLDKRVDAMRRGEGIPLQEFLNQRRTWKSNSQ